MTGLSHPTLKPVWPYSLSKWSILLHALQSRFKSSTPHLENKEWRKNYYKQYYAKIRLETLAKVDPTMKCAMCGCDDTRFLEVNHIKGGGIKDRKRIKKDQNLGNNMILLIHTGRRGVEDLNLLCRACNSIDHLEREYGKTRLRVVWDKKNYSDNSSLIWKSSGLVLFVQIAGLRNLNA